MYIYYMDIISYSELISNLQCQTEYSINIKPLYCVIIIPKSQFHITIFQDQWDMYEHVTGLPFHLFHISNNDEKNRCSSYFWVDKNTYRLKYIPAEYFSYDQPNFSFFASTRKPCDITKIKIILKIFQKILKTIMLKQIKE
jgi:hypothetical protein